MKISNLMEKIPTILFTGSAISAITYVWLDLRDTLPKIINEAGRIGSEQGVNSLLDTQRNRSKALFDLYQKALLTEECAKKLIDSANSCVINAKNLLKFSPVEINRNLDSIFLRANLWLTISQKLSQKAANFSYYSVYIYNQERELGNLSLSKDEFEKKLTKALKEPIGISGSQEIIEDGLKSLGEGRYLVCDSFLPGPDFLNCGVRFSSQS